MDNFYKSNLDWSKVTGLMAVEMKDMVTGNSIYQLAFQVGEGIALHVQVSKQDADFLLKELRLEETPALVPTAPKWLLEVPELNGVLSKFQEKLGKLQDDDYDDPNHINLVYLKQQFYDFIHRNPSKDYPKKELTFDHLVRLDKLVKDLDDYDIYTPIIKDWDILSRIVRSYLGMVSVSDMIVGSSDSSKIKPKAATKKTVSKKIQKRG